MKKLRGIAHNIPAMMVGKITKKGVNFLKRKDFFLVLDSMNKYRQGYAGIISEDSQFVLKRGAYINDVEGVDELHEGDVVTLNIDGTINVLYEPTSCHNTLLLTELCNCRCIMCPQPCVVQEESKTGVNKRLISLMDKNTKFLGLTGGEPLLLGSDLIDIIALCKRKLPKAEVSLLTNGILLSDEIFVDKIVSVGHTRLTFEIPLYADTDTMHNQIIVANGFYKTIKCIYNLAENNQRIALRIVIHKLNYERITHLAEFIYRNFPFTIHVAFMQMETIGMAQNNLEMLWIDPFDYNKQLEKAVIYLNQRGLNVSIYNAQLCVLPKPLRKYARKSITPWKNIYLEKCDNCDYKQECGGFFMSSKDMHSVHVRALKKKNNKFQKTYKPTIKENSNKSLQSDCSPTLLKFVDIIAIIREYPILDIPCGFGRHAFLLSSLGCRIVCVDIDEKALQYIDNYKKTSNTTKGKLETLSVDLEKDSWRFNKESIGAIINIHCYRPKLFDKFVTSIVSGGYLYFETPGGHGKNYIDLPEKGSVKAKLLPYFNLIFYQESSVGPENLNRVTVKLFAQKLDDASHCN